MQAEASVSSVSGAPTAKPVREREELGQGMTRRAVAVPAREIAAPGHWWRVADALLAVSVLTGVVIAGNFDYRAMPRDIEEFLAIRLSLKNVLLLTAFGLTWPGILSLCGLYTPARLREGIGDWPRLVVAGALGCVLATVFPLTSRSGAVHPEHVLIFAAIVVPLAALLRSTARAVERDVRGTRQKQVVLVGSGPLAARMYWELQADPLRVNIVGFVDSEPQTALADAGAPHLGVVEDLERILMNRVVDDVVIGLPIKSRYDTIHQTIAACERVGVPAKYPADLFRDTLGLPLLDGRVTTPFLSFLVAPDDYRLLVKRVIDVVGAAALLVALAPVMLAVALVVKLTSPGPALFAQERYGYMKRRFRMYKFRTMVADAEGLQSGLEHRNEKAGPVFKIRDDPRLTVVGRFLRRTSLDELPQLWNVFTGEMSLVGPRPMSVRDVGRFEEPWLMRRFSVLPGLTCLWQIQGRSNLSFDDWVALDLEYIDRWSLFLDFKILLRTIPAVLSGRGAN